MDHSNITSSKRWVAGVRKWQFLMIYSTVHHQRGGWVGLKKSKTWWHNTWMPPGLKLNRPRGADCCLSWGFATRTNQEKFACLHLMEGRWWGTLRTMAWEAVHWRTGRDVGISKPWEIGESCSRIESHTDYQDIAWMKSISLLHANMYLNLNVAAGCITVHKRP